MFCTICRLILFDTNQFSGHLLRSSHSSRFLKPVLRVRSGRLYTIGGGDLLLFPCLLRTGLCRKCDTKGPRRGVCLTGLTFEHRKSQQTSAMSVRLSEAVFFSLRQACRPFRRTVLSVPVAGDGAISNAMQRRMLSTTSILQYKAFNRYDVARRHELYRRRREAGPEPLRHRNVRPNWNYDAEVFAFGARLGENTTSETFRLAFISPSYTEREIARRREVFEGVESAESSEEAPNNTGLRDYGSRILGRYIAAFCRYNFPFFPEDGIQAICNHMMSEAIMSNIASHLGATDLVQSDKLPVSNATLKDALLAVVGALAEDFGRSRAEDFIRDFIMTSLLDADINVLLDLKDPMEVVANILARDGRPEPETRLLRRGAVETPEAYYCIGVYSDKKLLGESFGETLLIAEEMSAHNTLQRLFRTATGRRPLLLGKKGKEIGNIDAYAEVPNPWLHEWTEKECIQRLAARASKTAATEQLEEGTFGQSNVVQNR